jgi:hypothetical protein
MTRVVPSEDGKERDKSVPEIIHLFIYLQFVNTGVNACEMENRQFDWTNAPSSHRISRQRRVGVYF